MLGDQLFGTHQVSRVNIIKSDLEGKKQKPSKNPKRNKPKQRKPATSAAAF